MGRRMTDTEKEDKRIHREIDKLRKLISDSERKIRDLQGLCSHPGIHIKYMGDTGNWCPYDDSYWADWSCPNCGWRNRSSQEEATRYLQLHKKA